MIRTPIHVPEIQGWMPSIHNALSASPKIIAGRNFRWSANSVCSGWGNDFVSNPIPFPAGADAAKHLTSYLHSFQLGARAFVVTCFGIYTQSYYNAGWTCAFSFSPTLDAIANSAINRAQYDYPWSCAFIGDTYYLCHPAVGIITYQYPTDCWNYIGEQLGNDTGLITGPYFSVAEVANRLIVQTIDTISWSAIDDGLNHDVSSLCGGNFVSASVVEYGQPIGIASFGDTGIVWTTKGAMNLIPFAPNSSQSNITIAMGFRINRIKNALTPVNPYAFTSLENGSVAYLAKSGLRITNGSEVNVIDQEFDKYLCDIEMPRLATLHNQHAIRLSASSETAELFISTIHHDFAFRRDNIYEISYVYSFRHGKWGIFNQPHYVICPVNFGADIHLDYMLGFIGDDLMAHWFNFAYHNSQYGAAIPLDSHISIGPLTLTNRPELFYVETILSRFRLYVEDRNTTYDPTRISPSKIVDLSSAFAAEVSVYSDFDASSAIRDDGSDNPVKSSQTPPKSSISKRVKTFGCSSSGLYHTIKIQTNDSTVDNFYAVSGITAELGSTKIT